MKGTNYEAPRNAVVYALPLILILGIILSLGSQALSTYVTRWMPHSSWYCFMNWTERRQFCFMSQGSRLGTGYSYQAKASPFTKYTVTHPSRRYIPCRFHITSTTLANWRLRKHRHTWRLLSSGMWRRVDLAWIDVSEERIASIFRMEKSTSEEPA
jgi:hypothetical protein